MPSKDYTGYDTGPVVKGNRDQYREALAQAIHLIDYEHGGLWDELPLDSRTMYLHEADRWAEDPERRMR